ncbi:MAG: hypothetical protein PHR28_00910 [candidate division Zixibacteria bacterium]|nr:hypothetical protein [candidate division Zixibacteria bacterium]
MTAYRALSAALVALAIILPGASLATAAEPVAAKAALVDFDGDGIDDNLADLNGNSIPDRFEKNPAAADEAAPQGTLGNIFDATSVPVPAVESTDRAAAFGERQFPTRAIAPHRAGFGADEKFGPGNDIGIGSLTSGCAGGVCHF